MSAAFDPYHKWLGIPPAEQPPHHYRLLGLALFEHDGDVIEIAADQRMALLRSFHTGPHSDMSQRLLNEVAAARLCLLKPDRRERYDEVLRARLSLKQPSSAFDVVHERKNPPAAPNQAAKAPPPVPGLAVKAPPPIPNTAAKPPPVPAAVKPPPVLSAPPPAPAAAKPAAAIKTASDSPATAIAIRGPTDLAKPASAGTDTIELIGKSAKKTREIELAPKSSDWDQAIAEACSTQSVVYRRRRRWHISQSLIQFAIGASLLAGLLYGGAVAFRMWQDYDSKRVNEKLIAKKTSPPPPPMSTTTTTTTSAVASDSQSDDSSVNQPERQPTETPNFGARRANGASLPPDQASPRNSTGDAGANNQPSVPVPAGNQTSGRRPVPGLAAQKKAGTEIDDIFKRDYKEAATALSGKAALAKLFVRVARDTNDDPAKHYVLDDRALTMAIEFGDVDLAADVVRDLIANFQVDPWEVRISALNKLVRANGPWLQRTRIAQGALPLVDDAIAEGRFDEALELSELSLRMANNSRDVALREQSRNAVERVKLAQKRLVAFEAATSALAGNPDDPNAHLTVGKYLCFAKQDWQEGLLHLAKSDDEPLRRLAEREAQPPTMPADQLSLADSWWELAAERDDPKNELESKAMRARAANWYRQAMPGLSGINLEKARRRAEGI